jgi:hypothetical protein
MTIETTIRFRNYSIQVVAEHHEGYSATLEEPGLDEQFDIISLVIKETEYDPEELAALLEMTETELDEFLFIRLKQQIEYDKYNNF